MVNSFFLTESAPDTFYNNVRDRNEIHFKDAKNFVEDMWQKYAIYAEPEFLKKAQEDFHAKTWEMYLGCTFLDYGFNLQEKKKIVGPDLCLLSNGRKIWIEAVAPTSGTGNNAIPETKDFEVYDVPADKILLRFRGAIEEKYEKYRGYKDSIISSNDYYIIAVNGGRVSHSILEQNIPHIVKCVLPFGNQAVTIDMTSSKIVNSSHEYRDTIATHKGSPVYTNIFENRYYSGISAILYSWMNVVTHPNKIGIEMQCVHNPLADNKLPHGIFPFGTEWWVESNQLIQKNYK